MRYWQPFGITDPNASYVNADPRIGLEGSIPPAGSIEQDQREIVAVIEASNLTPREDDTTQLMQGVRSQLMNYAIATNAGVGQQNAITVFFNPPIGDTMTPGMPLRIKAAQTVTGPATLSVDNVVFPLRRADGAELANLDIVTAETFECLWNDTFWSLTNYRGTGGAGAGTVNNFVTKIPYTIDVGTTNAVIANFSPAIVTVVPGDTVEVKLANTITGPATLKVNNLAAVAIKRSDGTALKSGDGVATQIALLIYRDDNSWQFEGILPQDFTGMGVPIGCIILTSGNAAPSGTIKLNGALINRSDHPLLWAFANASGRLVSETDWQNGTLRNWTSFSSGNGTTTFRLPDFRGEFMRFFDDGRGVDQGRLLTKQQIEGIGSFSLAGNASMKNAYVSTYAKQPGGGRTPYPAPQYGMGVDTNIFPFQFGFLVNTVSFAPGAAGSTITYSAGGLSTMSDQAGSGLGYGTVGDLNGQFELSASGGAGETRPRNAPVIACIVDG